MWDVDTIGGLIWIFAGVVGLAVNAVLKRKKRKEN